MVTTIRPRRLLASGSSSLSHAAAVLWRELGKQLAVEDGLVVLTGGFGGGADGTFPSAADRMIVDGMLSVLRSRGVPVDEHVETMLPDAKLDEPGRWVRFKEGRVQVLNKRNAQSRRFSMVHSADVITTIAGDSGTRSVLDVALALERPVLPLPVAGGASLDVWRRHREEIVGWFDLDPSTAQDFEVVRISELSESQLRGLATRVRDCLLRGFTQGCFVIMRFHAATDPVFDQAISPALAAHGFRPWRTDRSVATGDIVGAIRDGISHCAFAIADTTDDRPNVMYELGFAHARNKPVILLRRTNADGSMPAVPFDFQTHSILTYTNDLEDLRRRLDAAVAALSGQARAIGV